MLDQVLGVFGLKADHDLDLMTAGQSPAEVTARVLQSLPPLLRQIKPDVLLVQGDTMTTFAAAFAAYLERIPSGHVEAGLRTGDRYQPFPEEMNRRVVDLTLKEFRSLRADGVKVGVLSNTIWPREWHVGFFERDGVYDLIDGDVYTSEIPWTKPSPKAFAAAMAAVGATDPARCVYVGDRLFDDVWGAHQAGMRAIHIPHSTIPTSQVGHTEGEPDAVAHRLPEIHGIVSAWY